MAEAAVKRFMHGWLFRTAAVSWLTLVGVCPPVSLLAMTTQRDAGHACCEALIDLPQVPGSSSPFRCCGISGAPTILPIAVRVSTGVAHGVPVLDGVTFGHGAHLSHDFIAHTVSPPLPLAVLIRTVVLLI